MCMCHAWICVQSAPFHCSASLTMIGPSDFPTQDPCLPLFHHQWQLPLPMSEAAMILILLLILGFPPIIAAQPWHICGTRNFTANGTYQFNVDFGLSSSSLTIGSDPEDPKGPPVSPQTPSTPSRSAVATSTLPPAAPVSTPHSRTQDSCAG
jgi:hypothetical protein